MNEQETNEPDRNEAVPIEAIATPSVKRGKRRKPGPTPGCGMKGYGRVFQPKYRDRKTGKRVTGSKWAIQFSSNGRMVREFGFEAEQIAKDVLEVRLREVRDGRALPPELRRVTLDHLLALVERDYQRKANRSVKRMARSLKVLRGYFGGETSAEQINGNRIEEFVTDRLNSESRYGRPFSNASVNRDLAILRHALHLGTKTDPPLVLRVPRITMLGENAPRSGFFESDELARIITELPDYLVPVIRTLYVTGWRIGEVLSRQDRHLDLKAGFLRLDVGECKDKMSGRTFPLTPELHKILSATVERKRQIERERGAIIPHLYIDNDGSPIKDFRTAWKAACKRAGLGKKLVHDFRRTAVRNLNRAGVARSTAMALVGHRTESIYRRYSIDDEATLKEAVAKLALVHQADAVDASEPVVVAVDLRKPLVSKI